VPAGNCAALLWTSGSAYLLSVPDGTIISRWHRPKHAIDHACVAGDLTLLVTRRLWGKDRLQWPVAELRAYRGGDVVYVRAYPRWAGPTVRYESASGRVYEATSFGVGILDPRTGDREVAVNFARGGDPYSRVLQPSLMDGRLYAVGEDGRVFALEHP
jgi:hypothetical protein